MRRPVFLSSLALAALATGLWGCGSKDDAPLPEELWCYPVSAIIIKRNDQQPFEAIVRANKLFLEAKSGRSFADLARRNSDDPESAAVGGFLGFMRPADDEIVAGAIQALAPGVVGGPVRTQRAIEIMLRHTFDEGREIEARSTVAAYGFLVPWKGSAKEAERTKEEARQLAESLLADVTSGKKTVEDAARSVLGDRDVKPAAYIGLIRDAEPMKGFYEALRAVPVGGYIPVADYPGGYSVVKRGPLVRCILREILIQHVESPSRKLSIRRTKAEAKELAEKVLSECHRDGSNWPEMVRRYHDDPGLAAIDGSVGVVSNDLPPPMVDVLVDTPPGEVASRLAETPEGYHILYKVK